MEHTIILEHTRRMLSATGISIDTFAAGMLVPQLVKNGIIAKEDHEDAFKWKRAQGKRIGRIFNGQTFPLQYKDSWIEVLPEPYRNDIDRDILAHRGFANVRLPELLKEGGSIPASLSDLTERFSRMLAKSLPAHDGVYDETDIATASPMIDALYCLADACKQEALKITAATGVEGLRHTLFNGACTNG